MVFVLEQVSALTDDDALLKGSGHGLHFQQTRAEPKFNQDFYHVRL